MFEQLTKTICLPFWCQFALQRGGQVEMPFRYMVDENRPALSSGAKQPLMPDGMRELIKKDLGRSFEF